MKRLLLLSLLCSPGVWADVITTRPKLEVDLPANLQRVCYFEGKQYSRGAMIQVQDKLLVCERENEYETNGALGWMTQEEASKRREAAKGKITVN